MQILLSLWIFQRADHLKCSSTLFKDGFRVTSLKTLASLLSQCIEKNMQNVWSKLLVNGTWKTVGVSFLFLNWTRTTLLFLNLLHDEPVLWEVWTQWTWDQLKVLWLSVAALNYSCHVNFCYIKACLTRQLVLNYKQNFLCLRRKPRRIPDETIVLTLCWLLIKYNYRLANLNHWFPQLVKFQVEWSRKVHHWFIHFFVS